MAAAQSSIAATAWAKATSPAGLLATVAGVGLAAVYCLTAARKAQRDERKQKQPLPKLGSTDGLQSAPAPAKLAAAAAATTAAASAATAASASASAGASAGTGSTGEERFSAAAETWDLADRHQLLAAKGVQLLRERCTLDAASTEVLEFGCGTAGVSLGVAPFVKRVVALDSAPGMIAVVTRRVAERKLESKVVPLLRRVDTVADWPSASEQKEKAFAVPKRFDVIYTAMAFHHVPDPHACLRLFRDLLKPNGVVMIVDLVKTEVSTEYHPLGTHGDVYAHGFVLHDIAAWMRAAGLNERVRVAAEFTVHKAEYDHPIFVASASKCH